MIDSGRRSDPGGLGGATRPLLMDARRYGVSAPLRRTRRAGDLLVPRTPGDGRRRRASLSRRKISVADKVFLTAVIGFLLQRSLAQMVARVSAG